MRRALLPFVVRVACVIGVAGAACAGPSTYRDTNGHPVPTTARIDADSEPVLVRCGGTTYSIVTPPVPYATGTHLATRRPFVRDPAVMCARIRAAE